MSLLDVVVLAAGLVLLVIGAELLVRGAAFAALALGISPLVIGLTVVSFGTSAPELVTGLVAAARGEPGIVVGNVVGSNLFNVLVILGLAAVIAPLAVDRQLVRVDVPVMVALSLAVPSETATEKDSSYLRPVAPSWLSLSTCSASV
jgi:cation:H+ antiporter